MMTGSELAHGMARQFFWFLAGLALAAILIWELLKWLASHLTIGWI